MPPKKAPTSPKKALPSSKKGTPKSTKVGRLRLQSPEPTGPNGVRRRSTSPIVIYEPSPTVLVDAPVVKKSRKNVASTPSPSRSPAKWKGAVFKTPSPSPSPSPGKRKRESVSPAKSTVGKGNGNSVSPAKSTVGMGTGKERVAKVSPKKVAVSPMKGLKTKSVTVAKSKEDVGAEPASRTRSASPLQTVAKSPSNNPARSTAEAAENAAAKSPAKATTKAIARTSAKSPARPPSKIPAKSAAGCPARSLSKSPSESPAKSTLDKVKPGRVVKSSRRKQAPTKATSSPRRSIASASSSSARSTRSKSPKAASPQKANVGRASRAKPDRAWQPDAYDPPPSPTKNAKVTPAEVASLKDTKAARASRKSTDSEWRPGPDDDLPSPTKPTEGKQTKAGSPQKAAKTKRVEPAENQYDGKDEWEGEDVDPFYMAMPLPEVWHRNMPALFPYGETPFMERYISDQIEEDLRRGQEEMGKIPKTKKNEKKKEEKEKTMMEKVGNAVNFFSRGSRADKPTRGFWDLPSVSDEQVRQAVDFVQNGHEHTSASFDTTRKRKNGQSEGSAPKRRRAEV